MNKRLRQVNALIEKELSLIFIEELDLKEGSFLTITASRVSADLKRAKIYVSVFPFHKRIHVLDLLKRRRKLFQTLLRKRIHIKFIPKLEFIIDDTEEKASAIEDIINQDHTGTEE